MTASTTPSRGPLLKTLLSLAVLGMLRITRHLPLSWLRALGAIASPEVTLTTASRLVRR